MSLLGVLGRQVCNGDCQCRSCASEAFELPRAGTKGYFSVRSMTEFERGLHAPFLDGVYMGQATDWLVGAASWVDVLPETTDGKKHFCRCGASDVCRRRVFGTVECRR